MRTFLHVLLPLLFCLTSPVIALRDWIDSNYKIGHTGQFPYVAYLAHDVDGLRCGASIIRDDIVLTAAHCVIGKDPFKMKIKAGGSTTNGIIQTVRVRDFHVHYRSGNKTDPCDIALVKLDGLLELGANVQYVDLAEKGGTFEGQVATALYWVGSDVSKTLQKVPFDIVSNQKCVSTPSTSINEKLCGFDFSRGRGGVTDGSSGGPLVLYADLTHMMHKQIGVVCENEVLNSTLGFVSISSLRPWIDAVLGSIYEIESSSEEEEDNFIHQT